MKKVYCVITLTIYYLFLAEGMVLTDGMEYLDYLLQNNYRYEHHLQYYQTSLKTGLIPNGMKSCIMHRKIWWNFYYANLPKLLQKI